MKELCKRRFNRQWACSDLQRERLDLRTELDDAFGPSLSVGPRPGPGHCIVTDNQGRAAWVPAEEERRQYRERRVLAGLHRISAVTDQDITDMVLAGHLEEVAF